VPYSKDSAVLIGPKGICFMGMHLMSMHLTGGLRRKLIPTNWIIGVLDIQIASISVSKAIG
jgi:hypothetical protein